MKISNKFRCFTFVALFALAQTGLGQSPYPGNYVYPGAGPDKSAPPRAVVDATGYAGADMGEKIAAAEAAVYSRGGGIVDARGFTCPAQCHIGTANLVIGDGRHPIMLILPTGTITRDTISGTRRSAQILYDSYATIQGSGPFATKILGPSDVTAVQQRHGTAAVIGATLAGFSIKDTGTVVPGSAALMVGGKNPDGSKGSDVLMSDFENLSVSGADLGTLMDSQGGCICYNKFHEVNSAGATAGIKTVNSTGWMSGVNSNQWTTGNIGGPIGLWDAGSGKFTWSYLDFENNKSTTGKILYARQDGNRAGEDYSIGDTVSPAGGGGDAVLIVTSVGAGGAVTGLKVSAPGRGYANLQSVPTRTITGSGSGLKVDIRVSAYMLLLSNSGALVVNPYEEAGGGDYLCGTGNFVFGAFFATNGASYAPTYCTGPTGGYGGPLSNFVLGSGAAPRSFAVGQELLFGGNNTFDDGMHPMVGMAYNGPSWAGWQPRIYGKAGHSDWQVGLSQPFSGLRDSGKITARQLIAPIPSVSVGGGRGSVPYTYALVCHDANGGVTLPGSFSKPVEGPSALGAWLTASVVNAGSGGYRAGDLVKILGGDGAAQIRVDRVDGRGHPTSLSVVTPGSGYRTRNRAGGGRSTVFRTAGGSGEGLTITGTSSYMHVTFALPDGCRSWDILRGDTKTALDKSKDGYDNASAEIFDFGPTIAFEPAARNSTGDAAIAGQLSLGGTSAVWTSGAGAPTGACATGSLYTNTRGGTGSTLFACEGGKWAPK